MVANATVAQIRGRAKSAWARQSKWDAVLAEAYSYALPHRNTFSGRIDTTEGQLNMENVVDSTAMISTARAAGRIQRDLTPPFERFFTLEPGPLWPADTRDDYARHLQTVTELAHTVLQHSNFPMVSHESYLDLLSGRCNMLMLRGTREKPINCVAVPRSELAIEGGAFGSIRGMYRKRWLEVDLVEQEYPGAKIPADWPKTTAKDVPKKELYECTYLDGDDKWKSVLFDTKDGPVIWKTTYRRTSPWIVARYLKVSGEDDGRGPLLFALPDIRTANRATEMALMEAALALSGVYTVTDDDVVNLDTVAIAPGVFIKVERNAGSALGPSIAPLQTGREFDLAQIVLETLRANIKKILIDNELPPEDGAVRSPTEFLARQKDFYEDSGSAFGRLQAEWIVPIVQRSLDILSDPAIGLIREITIDQLLTKVQVTSPLAQVQKLRDVKSATDWATILQTIGGPELVALCAKIEDMGDYLGDRLGVAATLRRSVKERGDLQKLIASMVAQRQAPAPPQAQGGA